MTALELVGVVVLIVLALALPAIGESVRRRSDGVRDSEVDKETLSRLDSEAMLDEDRDR